MTDPIQRRDFIRKAALAGAGIAGMPALLANGSANEKLVVAIMGTNSRGAALCEGFAKLPGAEVAYVCDVDDQAMAKGLKAVQQGGQKTTPKGVKDFRRALDDKAVDVLVIAAPDHWHAPASILALKAGKHVYVEKPCSHNPREGEVLLDAARRYNKVVNMGNQRRSWPYVVEGIQAVKNGVIGRAYYAKAWYANTRQSIGKGKPAPIPAGLDYDLWQGPAPRRDYRDNLIHYNWHWFWHWGTGELLNNGTHFIDLCRWGLEVDYPTRVSSQGGRYAFDDDWETPDTQLTNWDFADRKSMSWEGRSCNGRNVESISGGVAFYGEKGTLIINGNGYTIYDNKNKELKKVSGDQTNPLNATGPGFDLDVDHLTNFRDAIRLGKRPNSSIEEANKSVLLCHLGNIAHRTGRVLNCDPVTGKILNDPDAMKLWGREYAKGWEPAV
ncbi:Gfo/Idh/MocA family protein [Nibrella viscosa]|uniref:Gfo/Idh/MocA family protein n=1 Tax=Nibrella viscosa TaxID=1084524 RepID=UPI0031E52601